MKNFIIINGTMGVGKTATSMELKPLVPDNAFLDGDWCWNLTPFTVTEETKSMVLDNISFILNNFISCSTVENIIFCWVLDSPEVLRTLLAKIRTGGCRLYFFTLTCSETALVQRLREDIRQGKRTKENAEDSLSRRASYEAFRSIKIDVSNITPAQAAQQIRDAIR